MRGIASVTKCIKLSLRSARVYKHTHRAQSSGGVGGGAKINYKIHHCVAQEKWEVWEILIYCTPTGENSFTSFSSSSDKSAKRGRKKALLEYSAAFPFPVKHHLSLSTIIHYHHQLHWAGSLTRCSVMPLPPKHTNFAHCCACMRKCAMYTMDFSLRFLKRRDGRRAPPELLIIIECGQPRIASTCTTIIHAIQCVLWIKFAIART